MKRFTAKIVDVLKQEKLYASQGGPVILSQVDFMYFVQFLPSPLSIWTEMEVHIIYTYFQKQFLVFTHTCSVTVSSAYLNNNDKPLLLEPLFIWSESMLKVNKMAAFLL